TSKVKTSESKPKSVSEPLIEDWISDSESENKTDFNHLIKDCDYYEKKMVEKPVWNNARRVNHQNSQRMSHPHPKRNFVPKAVLMKSSLNTLNTARQNYSRAAVSVNTGNATTVGPKAVVSDNKGNKANAVKASACWVWRPKQKVLDHGNPQKDLKDKYDSGCSRHITGNRSYLTDYEEIDGRFVAFGGSTKGGKITRKVSQMCDKKNSILFTDIECVVLSSDFKLTDESHVLLKVLRKDNMYSVELKNVAPSGEGKATQSFL
ncbi:hypothetical protein Tco_1510488, partial [Tanacetum coccineum]